jgi:hypothetical protein
MNYKLYTVLILFLFLFSGCGGVKETFHENCLQDISIYSSENLHFYTIKNEGKYYYTWFKVPKEDYNFCFHVPNSSYVNSCETVKSNKWYAKKLPINTKITFDGLAVKTRLWGIDKFVAGPQYRTLFRGELDSGQNIWVSTSDLLRIFERTQNRVLKNKDAFEKLEIRERIIRGELAIDDWNCSIK